MTDGSLPNTSCPKRGDVLGLRTLSSSPEQPGGLLPYGSAKRGRAAPRWGCFRVRSGQLARADQLSGRLDLVWGLGLYSSEWGGPAFGGGGFAPFTSYLVRHCTNLMEGGPAFGGGRSPPCSSQSTRARAKWFRDFGAPYLNGNQSLPWKKHPPPVLL